LPKALRTELEELGHITPLRKDGRLARKDRRRANRKQAAINRGENQGGKKRRAGDDGDSDDEPSKPVASTSKVKVDPTPAKKRVKIDAPEQEEVDVQPQKKQTPLEKLLAKQERGNGPDPARKRGKHETDEDKEIAWLEWHLKKEKGKAKEDADDGLDGVSISCSLHLFLRLTVSSTELFDGLGDLEGAAFGTSKKVRFLVLFPSFAHSLPLLSAGLR
jgi:nucleolar MIF4G domain-containing protein 1